MRAEVSTLGDCGCGCGGAGACGDKTKRSYTLIIDTPVRSGTGSSVPITRMLGHVMGIRGLEQVQPNSYVGPVMSRASNMAHMTWYFLLQFKPEARIKALTDVGGFNWSNSVLSMAKNMPSGSVDKNLKHSLGFHFLLGAIDAEGGKNSDNATAYLAFVRTFKDAQNRREGTASSSGQLSGIGALSAVGSDETKMADDHAWCEANKGKSFPNNELEKCKRCPTPGGLINSKKNSYNYAEWYGDWICKKPGPSSVEGRRFRNLAQNWAPAVNYPAPPNIASVDINKFQVANCFMGLDSDRNEKRLGVTSLFKQVFGRDPNNAEVQYYGEMKWCVTSPNPQGSIGATMRGTMEDVRKAIIEKRITTTTPVPSDAGPVTPSMFATRTTFGDWATSAQQTGTAIQTATNTVINWAFEGATKASNIICEGLKAIMGPIVGGAVCEVIKFFLTQWATMAATITTLVSEGYQGIFDFLKFVAQGNWEQAMMALLKAIGRMLFALSAPVAVPIMMGAGKMAPQQAFAKLKEKADRITEKNPLFVIILVLAIVQLTITPTPLAIAGVVLSISPMVAAFAAEPLLADANVRAMSGIDKLDDMERAIENIIKLVCIIIQGLLMLPDIIPKLKGQLQGVLQRRFAGDKGKALGTTILTTIRAFEQGFNSFKSAIEKFKMQQVTEAAVQLLNTVPLVLAAFVGPTEMAAGAVPSITDWFAANEAAGRSVDQQQAALRDGALQFLQKLPFPQAMLVAVDRAMAENDLKERARMAALIVGRTFKENRPGFESTFVSAFRAELIKV